MSPPVASELVLSLSSPAAVPAGQASGFVLSYWNQTGVGSDPESAIC